jgi:SAM-dependent methyltransferase
MTTSGKPKRRGRKHTAAARADRHRLYEDSVQDPDASVEFVEAEFRRLTGRRARLLREDFCGTAKTACEWVRRHTDNRAVGVDLDPEVLGWARDHNVADLRKKERARVALVEGDVNKVKSPPQDVVMAMNFSYWIFHERRALRNYFRKVRNTLADDGVFFLDCFGGYDAYRLGSERRDLDGYTYQWELARYNPVDARVLYHIHFRFDDGSRLKRAFTYDWRHWTLPEITEVLREAGFARVTVYAQGWDEKAEEGDGVFVPVEEIDADAGWVCNLAAQRS